MIRPITISLILCFVFFSAITSEAGNMVQLDRPVIIQDTNSDKVNVTTSGAILAVTTTYEHHELHEGNRYSTYHQATLASGSAYQLLINTPLAASGKNIHLRILARGSGEGVVTLYEYPTISAIGSAKEEINRNRQSSNTALTEITLTPTITALGNIIMKEHFGSGPIRGGSFGSDEFVLKAGTFYLINGVSEAAGNDLSIMPDWYEDSGDAP
jgi:hypothetical protein